MNKELETKCPVCGMPAYYREDEVIAICSECGRASQINPHIDSHDLPCIECGKSMQKNKKGIRNMRLGFFWKKHELATERGDTKQAKIWYNKFSKL